MRYRIELHPLAQEELEQSFQWYEERLEGLGNSFLTAVQNRFDRISKTPESYARKKGNYREVLVSGYPFTIIYEILEKHKIVFVSYIFHTKRNPLLKYKR